MHETGSLAGNQTLDPVCGMAVDLQTAKHRATFDGVDFAFCSASCKSRFEAEPARYVKGSRPPSPPPPADGTIYTCPMHPQIRQPMPGNCPICGMTLEPLV